MALFFGRNNSNNNNNEKRKCASQQEQVVWLQLNVFVEPAKGMRVAHPFAVEANICADAHSICNREYLSSHRMIEIEFLVELSQACDEGAINKSLARMMEVNIVIHRGN